MGYEQNFVSDISKEFLCTICTLVLENPVETRCEHIFCSKCIKEWIKVQSICPVDRQAIRLEDLKPTPKYYRNLLDNLEVRCEFESFGCKTTFALNHLQNHLLNCIYKPNAAVVCDKGCKMIITRQEYENNCLAHLTTKLEQLQDKITKLEEEQGDFKRIINRQQEQIQKQIETTCRQREVIQSMTIARNEPSRFKLPRWKTSFNMKISKTKPIVLAPMTSNFLRWAFVQFNTRLSPSNSSFRIRVSSKSDDASVVVGLTQVDNHDEKPGRMVGSICYYSEGKLVVSGIADAGFKKLNTGDIIECGLIYPAKFKKTVIGEVYYTINEVLVVKKVVEIPAGGFYPTIHMTSTSVSKVEYLTYFK